MLSEMCVLLEICVLLELCATFGSVGFWNHVFLNSCLLGFVCLELCVLGVMRACVQVCKYASIVDGSGPLFYTDP